MENAKRNPRTIGLEKNQQKPAGEPPSDTNTGAPCPTDHVRGSYKQPDNGSPDVADDG